MLEFAGPLLYKDLKIESLERIWRFLVKPSSVLEQSRLRPHLGRELLRYIWIDFRQFKSELSSSTPPVDTWDALASANVVSVRLVQTNHNYMAGLSLSMKSNSRCISRLLRRLFIPDQYSYAIDFPSVQAENPPTFDILVEFVSAQGFPRTNSRRAVRMDLNFAVAALPSFLATVRSVVTVQVKVDFRRVSLPAEGWSKTATDLEAAVTFFMNCERIWLADATIDLTFQTASEPVSKSVAATIAASAFEDRKTRGHVVKV